MPSGYRPPMSEYIPVILRREARIVIAKKSSTTTLSRGLHEAKLIAVRVFHGHVQEPQIIVRGLGNNRAAITKLGAPGVHDRDHEVNEPANLTIRAVFGQVDTHPVANHRHEHRKTWLETMFPLDCEPERGNVVSF